MRRKTGGRVCVYARSRESFWELKVAARVTEVLFSTSYLVGLIEAVERFGEVRKHVMKKIPMMVEVVDAITGWKPLTSRFIAASVVASTEGWCSSVHLYHVP